jgi:hypothetical protein
MLCAGWATLMQPVLVSLKSRLQTKDAFDTPREIKNNADFTLRNGEDPINAKRINNLENELPQNHPAISL